jgi:hypothetical protein
VHALGTMLSASMPAMMSARRAVALRDPVVMLASGM